MLGASRPRKLRPFHLQPAIEGEARRQRQRRLVHLPHGREHRDASRARRLVQRCGDFLHHSGRTVRPPATKSIVCKSRRRPDAQLLGGALLFQSIYTCLINKLLPMRAGEDRPAQSRKGRLQTMVPGGIDGSFDTRGRLRVDFRRCPALRNPCWPWQRRAVYIGDPRHRAVAVEGGDPLQNLGFEMLKLDRDRPGDANPERAVPPQALGPRRGGDRLAHDRRPFGGDPRRHQPARLEGLGGDLADQRGERLGLAGYAHG